MKASIQSGVVDKFKSEYTKRGLLKQSHTAQNYYDQESTSGNFLLQVQPSSFSTTGLSNAVNTIASPPSVSYSYTDAVNFK